MKKLIVKNNLGEVLQIAKFDNQDQLDAFKRVLEKGESWGKPQHNVELTPRRENEDGTITEATYETIPSEYVLDESDITAEVEQQRINSEAEAYLLSTDWMVIRSIDGIAVPAEVTLERIAARARIIR
jgi:hypothetical protein